MNGCKATKDGRRKWYEMGVEAVFSWFPNAFIQGLCDDLQILSRLACLGGVGERGKDSLPGTMKA